MIALRMLVVLSVLTGFLYTLAVTVVGNVLFPQKTHGTLVTKNGRIMGSELLGQRFVSPCYFWSRPSSVDYETLPSGASNKGPTSQDLHKTVSARTSLLLGTNGIAESASVPSDLLYASGSGVDPHISPESARFQAHRIAQERHCSEAIIDNLVSSLIDGPQFGFLGEPRVNVLKLNTLLDSLDSPRNSTNNEVSSGNDTN